MEAMESFEKWWLEAMAIQPEIAPYKLLFQSGFYAGAAYGSDCALERVGKILGGKK